MPANIHIIPKYLFCKNQSEQQIADLHLGANAIIIILIDIWATAIKYATMHSFTRALITITKNFWAHATNKYEGLGDWYNFVLG